MWSRAAFKGAGFDAIGAVADGVRDAVAPTQFDQVAQVAAMSGGGQPSRRQELQLGAEAQLAWRAERRRFANMGTAWRTFAWCKEGSTSVRCSLRSLGEAVTSPMARLICLGEL